MPFEDHIPTVVLLETPPTHLFPMDDASISDKPARKHRHRRSRADNHEIAADKWTIRRVQFADSHWNFTSSDNSSKPKRLTTSDGRKGGQVLDSSSRCLVLFDSTRTAKQTIARPHDEVTAVLHPFGCLVDAKHLSAWSNSIGSRHNRSRYYMIVSGLSPVHLPGIRSSAYRTMVTWPQPACARRRSTGRVRSAEHIGREW